MARSGDIIWCSGAFGSCFGTLVLLPNWIWTGDTSLVIYRGFFGFCRPLCISQMALVSRLLWYHELLGFTHLAPFHVPYWFCGRCCIPHFDVTNNLAVMDLLLFTRDVGFANLFGNTELMVSRTSLILRPIMVFPTLSIRSLHWNWFCSRYCDLLFSWFHDLYRGLRCWFCNLF